MKLAEFAKELNLSPESIKQFIQDFDLDLNECISTNFEVVKDFEAFARENVNFLRQYEDDLDKNKTVDQIAKTINQPKEKIVESLKEHNPNIYENGFFRSSISSYGIDKNLGGNYNFVYDYFGHKTSLKKRDFIGYKDLFFYISNVLEPFLNSQQIKDWGIEKPAGIVLYGPPGSGKIFWATKIAEIIDYNFKEVKKHYMGISYVDGNKTVFNDFLVSMMKDDKVLLFMDDFDEIMMERGEDKNVTSNNEETKDIILHYINRFQQEDLLMVGSANSVSAIDEEVLAPGRFDVLIPIFPPNASERAEIILFSMTKGLEKDAMLYKILSNNSADKIPFWRPIASKMMAFSNTMVIDFTQSLKKRIKNLYQKNRNEKLIIDDNLLKGALRDASAKLTEEYLNQVAEFLRDVTINNLDDFQLRVLGLQNELMAYQIVEEPRRAIGFQHSDNDESSLIENSKIENPPSTLQEPNPIETEQDNENIDENNFDDQN